MGLNIGNTTIGGIYLGNTKISEAYLGSTKVYSAAAPQPTDEVTIGTQTWKSKNLAIDDGQGGISTHSVTYDGVNYVTEYYYNYTAAVRVANTISGWHLPSKSEYETLVTYIGGGDNAAKLCATYSWDRNYGTDIYGFHALGTGYDYNGTLYEFSEYSMLWSSTSKCPLWFTGSDHCYIDDMQNNNTKGVVRLVKD